MTVNERLFAAGLIDAYDAARASGDLAEMNRVLAKVHVRRDASGMHHEIANDA
jgi:hypothetical protein